MGSNNNDSKHCICPVCETEILESTMLCSECGWEIDCSEHELIIGDPVELQQEADQKHRRLQQYRKNYRRVKSLEKRVAELEQTVSLQAQKIQDLEKRIIEQQRTQKTETMKALEERIIKLERTNQTRNTLQKIPEKREVSLPKEHGTHDSRLGYFFDKEGGP